MIEVYEAARRGRTQLDWLDSRHTFSFAEYFDPSRRGFGPLRVINDDRVKAGAGFGLHPHTDMEILSYVLEGALAHADSTGTRGVIRAGDVQRMTAGTGVMHSELNPADEEPVHFLQIWVLPERRGLSPSYEQRHFDLEARQRGLVLIASPTGRDASLTVHQNVQLWATVLAEGDERELALAPGRRAWVQVARGKARVNGVPLREGDGLAVASEAALRLIGAGTSSELLVFELP